MLRHANIEDAEKIIGIYSPYVEKTAISFAYDPPSVSEIKDKIRSSVGRHIFLVLEIEEEILGCAYSSMYRERKAYEQTVEVSVYIHEDEKGKGYGRILMDELEKQLRENDAVVAIAVISSGNESSSRAFTKMGYTFSGHLPKVGYKFGNWYGIDHYYKILQEEA